MMAGAALAGANDDDLDALCRIASKSERVPDRDDILDVTSTMEGAWKPVFSDERMKNNVCDAVWHRRGGTGGKTAHERAVDELKNLSCPRDKIFLEELFESLTSRKK